MPRLGHKKSRLGCRQCKARHVKCDELKPCSNCSRHGVPCSLVVGDINQPPPPSISVASSSAPKRTTHPLQDATKLEASSTPSPSLLIDYVLNPPSTYQGESASLSAISEGSSTSSQSDQFFFLTRFIHRDATSQADIWVRDLELMHHWTLEAFDELSQRDDMRHVWRVEAPKHAVTHTFLMHEILAFSALHKAHLIPDERAQYYACSIHHQDLAIKSVKRKLHNVTIHEAPALVATSTLLTLSVFASTGFELNYSEAPTSQGAIDGILNIFNLMQGMINVLNLAQAHVYNSFLSPMFRDPIDVTPSQPMLQELLNQIPTLLSFVKSVPDLHESERELYIEVIGRFEPILGLSIPPRVDNRELRFLFFWPLNLQPDFLSFLRQRHSGALAILMYYSTILFASQSRYWFMDRWGETLMRACFQELEQEWQPVVQWPMSFINHGPTYNLFAHQTQALQNPDSATKGPSESNLGFPQRRVVEVPYMVYPSASHFSHASGAEVNMASFTQQAAVSNMIQDTGAHTITYTKQSGPAEDAA
ncbi:hypothetical protein CC86DRAFT_37058 [Ophiobolus disseminans]|uniref:Zn(2)-C6 fungal-type domain-containing protein n=1 Tax=Ophiobolus disseminans TaxID=1469910 RepID=A0A6A6ZZL6_9PLEO|nr:hypothetical protein CC86DRAFT_37058 [Ophiobolus disseminans]